jgi:hypothetical protein
MSRPLLAAHAVTKDNRVPATSKRIPLFIGMLLNLERPFSQTFKMRQSKYRFAVETLTIVWIGLSLFLRLRAPSREG